MLTRPEMASMAMPPALPQSANPKHQALLREVEVALAALESACADAERILLKEKWSGLDESIREQRRLTHALQIAFDAAKEARTPEIDKAVLNRLRFIGMTRDRHIAHMRKAQAAVEERLNTLAQWKRAARKWLSGYAGPKKTTGIDRIT